LRLHSKITLLAWPLWRAQFSITSDGFIIAQTEPVSSGAFIGTVDDLARNLALLICDANLTPEETQEYGRLYDQHVKRSYA
jgi:hypothetical protein